MILSLDNDYTLPAAPGDGNWNKKTAKQQFSKKLITEKKLGYILAAIEYEYWQKLQKAEEQLSNSSITQKKYEKLVKQAKTEFEDT
ncbi:hypothetical protein [Microbulbifer spongiae]|uniref:Uncharacterized protein n=1 Tax=Microbulbifer spongiae TaxID=2944933 RepID=A0ABY9EDU7_9GAMM|nr:hypothetical protein [Microbulbifer sp. MI-G]WKD48921.1 hypothetical protein M8T91_13595 [Microbulbifer sp. MI-G]